MTSPIPGLIAWPVLAFVIVVTVGRWIFINETHIDRLINRSLSWGITGLLLREAWVEELATNGLSSDGGDNIVNLMRQASFGCILMAVAAIYGMAKIWGGADPEDTRRRQRIYDGVAVASTVIILIAGTPARRHGLLIDQYMGWEAVVAWSVFYAPLATSAVLVLRICVRELRTSDAVLREKVAYGGVLGLAALLALDSIAIPLVTVADVVRGSASADPEMVTKAVTFFVATIAAAVIAAVPLVGTLIRRGGWDRPGRYWRRLQPLWADLTAAVPEVVMQRPIHISGRSGDSATRLHRTIVEIRDALLHLKPYGTTGLELPDVHASHNNETMFAFAQQVAEAIETKAAARIRVATVRLGVSWARGREI